MSSLPRPDPELIPVDTAADANRLVEDLPDDEFDVPLEAPIETPVADLIDQRRPVSVDDPDER